MSAVGVKNTAGEKVADLELSDAVYGIEPNVPVMHPVRPLPHGKGSSRDPFHQEPLCREGRRQEAVEAEGHRSCPPGFDSALLSGAAAAWSLARPPATTPSV